LELFKKGFLLGMINQTRNLSSQRSAPILKKKKKVKKKTEESEPSSQEEDHPPKMTSTKVTKVKQPVPIN